MVRVMATGVFDLLHPGHLHFLTSAKALGDELVVVVATDAMVRRRKHEPITPQEMRRQLIEGFKPVDRAVVGHEDDIYKTVEDVRPDIIALGYDQNFREAEVMKELEKRGMGHIRIVRLTKDASGHDLDGTRKIIAKVEQGLSFQRSMDKVEEKPAEQGGGNVGQGTGAAQGAEHSGPRQERARP